MQGIYFQLSDEDSARLRSRCHERGLYQGKLLRELVLFWLSGALDKLDGLGSASKIKQGRHGRGWTIEDMERIEKDGKGASTARNNP